MNKLAALLLALLAFSAHAGNLSYSPNVSGGEIVLTDVQGGCPTGSHAMYSVNGTGSETITGCWYYNEPFIHVDFDNGGVRNFNPNGFTFTDYAKRKYHLQ